MRLIAVLGMISCTDSMPDLNRENVDDWNRELVATTVDRSTLNSAYDSSLTAYVDSSGSLPNTFFIEAVPGSVIVIHNHQKGEILRIIR